MSESLKIEKISHVQVLTAMSEFAGECWEVIQLLRENEVPHNVFNWHTQEDVPTIIDPIKDWNLFDGEDWYQREVTKLPVIQWSVLYDDVTLRENLAVGVDELKESQLWKNLDKVV